MYGLVGFCSFQSRLDIEKLQSACALIQHRGPDASGIHFDRDVGLGHQRLSIIDLSDNANQPMSDMTGQAEWGTVIATINCEPL